MIPARSTRQSESHDLFRTLHPFVRAALNNSLDLWTTPGPSFVSQPTIHSSFLPIRLQLPGRLLLKGCCCFCCCCYFHHGTMVLLVLFRSNAAVDFAEDADVAFVSNRIALHSCTGVNRIFVQCDVYRSLGVSRSRHQTPCIRSAISFASEISSFS